ncbi:hypothetical protein CDAR_175931 [Caerostris darwini]|uniref:Uncharacterized protein n=1 Tax=Caerostris darwini TaxID=1538125 RepID=A0AAV4WNS9_9ARAC|nr:hypothetical protein CDAR_175931 [Caerostris darwini]
MSPSESWDAIKNHTRGIIATCTKRYSTSHISTEATNEITPNVPVRILGCNKKILYTRHHRNLHKRYSTSHISTEATNEITPNVSVRISGYNKKSYTRGIIATCTTKYSTSHISTEATNEITPNVPVRILGCNKKSYTRGIIATCTKRYSTSHISTEATNEITPNVPVRILGCNKKSYTRGIIATCTKGILLPISQQKQQMKLLQMSPSESWDAIKILYTRHHRNLHKRYSTSHISTEATNEITPNVPVRILGCNKNPIHEASSQPAQKGILLPISQQKQQMKLLQMSPSESWDAIKILYTRHHRNLHKKVFYFPYLNRSNK